MLILIGSKAMQIQLYQWFKLKKYYVMGVMSCSRKKCENIMCQTYIDDVGYICYECTVEFKEYLEKKILNISLKVRLLKN